MTNFDDIGMTFLEMCKVNISNLLKISKLAKNNKEHMNLQVRNTLEEERRSGLLQTKNAD